MRTLTMKVYKFSELSEEAKQNAISKHSDINVDYNWWDFVYEDAKTSAFLDIQEFDLDRRQIGAKLTESMEKSIKSVLENHGKKCDTYKTAKKFQEKYNILAVRQRLSQTDQLYDELEEAKSELADEYTKELAEDFRGILQREFDYQTSDKGIIEAIETNEYEFDEDGDRI